MRTQVAAWEVVPDRRCIFLKCYSLMTEAMTQSLDPVHFQDPAWVEQLITNFAGYYFAALDAYERGEDAPLAWRRAHELAGVSGLVAQQHLLLGINAHINHDLPLSVCDVMAAEWTGADVLRRDARRADFMAVNSVIATIMGIVEHDVCEHYDRHLGAIEARLSPVVRLGENVTAMVIDSWRDEAWSNAVRLAEATPGQRQAILGEIEEGSLHRVHAIVAEGEEMERLEHLCLRFSADLRSAHAALGIHSLRLHPELAGDPRAATRLAEVLSSPPPG